jgi:hypothetical protein
MIYLRLCFYVFIYLDMEVPRMTLSQCPHRLLCMVGRHTVVVDCYMLSHVSSFSILFNRKLNTLPIHSICVCAPLSINYSIENIYLIVDFSWFYVLIQAWFMFSTVSVIVEYFKHTSFSWGCYGRLAHEKNKYHPTSRGWDSFLSVVIYHKTLN